MFGLKFAKVSQVSLLQNWVCRHNFTLKHHYWGVTKHDPKRILLSNMILDTPTGNPNINPWQAKVRDLPTPLSFKQSIQYYAEPAIQTQTPTQTTPSPNRDSYRLVLDIYSYTNTLMFFFTSNPKRPPKMVTLAHFETSSLTTKTSPRITFVNDIGCVNLKSLVACVKSLYENLWSFKGALSWKGIVLNLWTREVENVICQFYYTMLISN